MNFYSAQARNFLCAQRTLTRAQTRWGTLGSATRREKRTGQVHCVCAAAKAASRHGGSMTILASRIDTAAPEFRVNAGRMRALVAELAQRRAEAAAGGPARARDGADRSRRAVPRAFAAGRQWPV